MFYCSVVSPILPLFGPQSILTISAPGRLVYKFIPLETILRWWRFPQQHSLLSDQQSDLWNYQHADFSPSSASLLLFTVHFYLSSFFLNPEPLNLLSNQGLNNPTSPWSRWCLCYPNRGLFDCFSMYNKARNVCASRACRRHQKKNGFD